MMQPRMLLFGCLFMLLAHEAVAMTCDGLLGMVSCPNSLQQDKPFCCYTKAGSQDLPYCCDFGEYAKNNKGVLAGIIIAALLIFLVIPVGCCVCCCFCAACPLYRVNRGHVLVR